MKAKRCARLVLVCIAGSVVLSGCDPAPENKDAEKNQDTDVVWPLTYAIHTNCELADITQVTSNFQAACDDATKRWKEDDSPQNSARSQCDKPSAVKFQNTGEMGRYGNAADGFAGIKYRTIVNWADLVELGNANHSYWIRIADLVLLPNPYRNVKAKARIPQFPPGKRGVAIDVNYLTGELLGHELGHNARINDSNRTCPAAGLAYIMELRPGSRDRKYVHPDEASRIIKVPTQ
jgi:hypothetical protein